MATTSEKAREAAGKEPAGGLPECEFIRVLGVVERNGVEKIRCRLPRKPGITDRVYGLNGETVRVMLGSEVELSRTMVEYIDSRLAAEDAAEAAFERRLAAQEFDEQ